MSFRIHRKKANLTQISSALPSQIVNNKNRFGLAIAINYYNTANQLNGCINDNIAIVKKLNTWGFNTTSLTDLPTCKNKPTIINVKNAFSQLLQSSIQAIKLTGKANIFIHYSGHGTQATDVNGDEVDGKDECMYVLDGIIRDDDVRLMLSKFPKECNIFMVMDCCHSGSVCDLQYNMNYNGVCTELSSSYKLESNITMISGCLDNQTAADAYILDKKMYYGACTAAFIKTLELQGDNLLLVQLWSSMLLYMINNKYSQRPALSCSKNKSYNIKSFDW